MKVPNIELERTCFQTGGAYSDAANLRSDVAICYGIDPGLPGRIATWRDRGYRIHVMTGVSWGEYQDYLYGRFDGVNHEDEAQTDRRGNKISHGGDVYYMCPGVNFGKFLCVGVKRALEAGAEAIHLEEPEFWVRGGYSEGFKREWRAYYNEDWRPPHQSADAQWRTSKLKYFLYRRALQQVFAFIQQWNKKNGKHVRCYVPTHSLVNYAHWRIVSPESSLAMLDGCDGYIAQVWTGTSRTPNMYKGKLKERTFETAFLEYGAMQNLVRATGRTVWYLNDPVEDDPNHDWEDYRTNWESTLVASLLQPDVWQYEVAPWPERVFSGTYPSREDRKRREGIPPSYATELQTVFNALNDMRQAKWSWDSGSRGIGVVVSDSLMFQRGEPTPSDAHMSHLYGLALPLLKRGMPVEPVQLESAHLKGVLDRYKALVMSYHGQKPLNATPHEALAAWVRRGGTLVFWDDDSDPFNKVREWWNADGKSYDTPRQHLFERLGLARDCQPGEYRVGAGRVVWQRAAPMQPAYAADGDQAVASCVRKALAGAGFRWQERPYLVLRRGPYIAAAGLDESPATGAKRLMGAFVNLFDADLKVAASVDIAPGARMLLLDLARASARPGILASACRSYVKKRGSRELVCAVEGIANTNAVVLLRVPAKPKSVRLEGADANHEYDPEHNLLRVRFANEPKERELRVQW